MSQVAIVSLLVILKMKVYMFDMDLDPCYLQFQFLFLFPEQGSVYTCGLHFWTVSFV